MKCIQHIDCVHKQQAHGYKYCFVGDIHDCDNCPHKHPKDIEVEEQSARSDIAEMLENSIEI